MDTLITILLILTAKSTSHARSITFPPPQVDELKPRIIGGHPVQPQVYPFHVHIKPFGFNTVLMPTCGGTLISKNMVLTAAHCLESDDTCILWNKGNSASFYYTEFSTGFSKAFAFAVKFGDTTFATYDQLYMEKTFRRHPGYSRKDCKDDIAVLRLHKDVNVDDHKIKIVELPTLPLKNYANIDANLVGWGMTETEDASPVLRDVKVTILDTATCTKKHKKFYRTQLCTSTSGPKGACFGDTGGPLMVDGVQIGIISCLEGHAEGSFARKNCLTEEPAIHTRVDMYKSWIDRALNEKDFFSKGVTASSSIIFVILCSFILVVNFQN